MSRRRRRISAAAMQAASQRKRRNMLWFGGLGAVALVLVVVVVSLSVSGGSGAGSSSTVGGDDLAPDFEFTLYQGANKLGAETLDLSRLRGKPVVLNFWAGLCPPCRAEMPGFQEFYQDSKDDVTLIGVDIGPFMNLGSRNDARALLEELNITYPAGFTNQGRVVRQYEVVSMPTTLFIDSKGEIFEKWSGFLDESTLFALTEAMLREEESQSPS